MGALNREEWLAACADLAKVYEQAWEEADKQMTHEDDIMIREAARAICYDQASKSDKPEITLYMSGAWDDTVWMRLVEAGIRRGMVIERAAITAWLRTEGSHYDCIYEEAANDIERGAHIKETT